MPRVRLFANWYVPDDVIPALEGRNAPVIPHPQWNSPLAPEHLQPALKAVPHESSHTRWVLAILHISFFTVWGKMEKERGAGLWPAQGDETLSVGKKGPSYRGAFLFLSVLRTTVQVATTAPTSCAIAPKSDDNAVKSCVSISTATPPLAAMTYIAPDAGGVRKACLSVQAYHRFEEMGTCVCMR